MTIYIIGGGIAGLSAAFYARKQGFDVSLFEASNHLGGRCFSFYDKELNAEIDNGTHFLSGANVHFFKLLSECQISDTFLDLGHVFKFYDKNANYFEVNLNTPISIMKEWKKIYPNLIESMLNTPQNKANKYLFFKTLMTCLFSKNKHFYTAKNSLRLDLIHPLQNILEKNIDLHLCKKVVFFDEKKIKTSDFTIQLKNDDFIISTISQIKNNFETILNIYFKTDVQLPHKDNVIGLSKCTGHWIIQKNNLLSVVISAANALKNTNIAPLVWEEIAPILRTSIKTPPFRVIKNSRATPIQNKKTIRSRQKFGKIIYAGDSVETGLPCTIEGAILSGENAINLIIKGTRE